MAGTSIASQLQTIRAALNISVELEPGKKRPFTRPSILFDAKAAADIDLDTILRIALSGLEVLISVDERFRNYKNDLFGYQSKELDRELVGQEENRRINASISSYLRLLSGYLVLHSAVKTLEYLIRRYKVHVYNKEDLILCGLPYHDTHVFVQIMQLIDTGNNRWKFLDGVKVSGARPPRVVIVQQCIRDMGVLEAICNYATPAKKVQPSKPVIGFCTAVIFEILGLATVDSDMVKRILPYLNSSLQPVSRDLDQKAGALMIVSLLTQKAALSRNVAKSLLHLVADTARADMENGHDLQWLRMSVVVLITIVQLQHVESIPKKTIVVLNKVRGISGIVSALSQEFNIEKFLNVFVDSLIEYSASDDTCGMTLLSLIEIVPMKAHVNRIASRLLAMQLNGSRDKSNPTSAESGSRGKQILTYLCAKYPYESQGAIFSFLKGTKPKNLNSSYDVLCSILDEHFASSHDVPDPKLFFSLEHSEAEIRRLAVSSLDVVSILEEKTAGSKKFVSVQDALFRRLYDDDLNVVLEVLSLNSLSDILSTPLLVEALQDVLKRCTELLLSSSSTKISVDTDAAFACLQNAVRYFKSQEGYMTTLATMIFPLLLVRPKTQIYNLKALELAEELNWPFYENLALPISGKELELGFVSSLNFEIINKFGERFSSSLEEYMPWLIKCCNSHELSKTLFFLVLLESTKLLKKDAGQFLLFFGSCFPFIKKEWEMLGSSVESMEQSRKINDCKKIIENLHDAEIKGINSEILVCTLWGLLEALTETMPEDASSAVKGTWSSALQDLFLFFTCHSKDLFKRHLEFLVAKCKVSLTHTILNMITVEGLPNAVQIESLHSLSNICSQLNDGPTHQVLTEFPSLLVPLSSDTQNVRVAAMNCIEKIYALPSCVSKTGNSGAVLHFLGKIIQQKKMLLSDTNVLPALFTSLFSSSSDSLLVKQAETKKRFGDSTKDEILTFIINHALGLPAYPKLKILSLFRGVGSKLMYNPGVRSLLSDLLETYQHTLVDGKLSCKLSQCEIDISCLLLESCSRPTSSQELHEFDDFILKALWINVAEDCVAVELCRTVLKNLSSSLYTTMKTETQVLVFHSLLVLFRSARGDVQNSAREAILRINLDSSVVGQVLDSILNQNTCSTGSTHVKKQKKSVRHLDCNTFYDSTRKKDNKLTCLSALLDVLLMKKDIKNRISLMGPLLKLLGLMFTSDELFPISAKNDEAYMPPRGSSDSISDTTAYVHQTLLLTLEDISNSIGIDALPKDIIQNFDLRLLINCARTSADAITRNHVFSLITALVKIVPDVVLGQIFDILSAIGESTITQGDSYTQRVFEGLILAVVPVWLSRNSDVDQLLQIFVDLMPQVAEHRRVSIISHILSSLGEAESLGSMLFLLFRSMVSRMSLLSSLSSDQSLDHLTLVISKQWEYEFAVQLCGHYSCSIWLNSLIILLKKIEGSILNEGNFVQILVAVQFISDKARDPEISYVHDSERDLNHRQTMIGELMEQVVCHQQLIDTMRKRSGVPATIRSELKICIRAVLRTLIKDLPSSIYFKAIIKLIGHEDRDVRKKALCFLCETLKDLDTNKKLEKKRLASSLRSSWLQLNMTSLDLVDNLTLEVLKLIDDTGDRSSTSLKVAAISALEVLASRFPSQERIFSTCLGRICNNICSDNSAISSHCLLATGAFVNALGLKSLPELPNVVGSLLKKSRDIYSLPAKTMKKTKSAAPSANSVDSVFMSILLALEAVIGKLAGFLNPYLVDILRLVVLHPLSFSQSEPKLKSKASALRELITAKIPVRLLLPPVLIIHADAVKSGESNVSVLFEMLEKLVGSMDRFSVSAYHAKIFDMCLLALDLRHQNPASIQNIDAVEQNVIDTFVTLTMKLTESMFRPLFVKIVEWSGSTLDGFATAEAASRTISFYNLVNRLAESHRSLFVPYFKYLLDGCVKGLVDTDDTISGATLKKRKKSADTVCAVSLQVWHLRALILSALHKCFLYDTGSSEFLDSSKFQVLLKPVVSQLIVDPPESIENQTYVPSVEEVDDMLVKCVGQMAVAAGSDLLWKPLNHEVLMQTRSEKIRARILCLRIVKYLVENLREEYLVFLPETIPFLGELLEDSELPVKSLAQEILLEMETMSGESLRQYL